MDKNTSFSEKHLGHRSDRNSDLHQITYRPYNDTDMISLRELLWQFYFDVNQEDTSGMKEFDVDGSKVEVIEAQARIYGYLSAGCKIQCAFVNDVLAGFLIFQEMFDRIIVIRVMFIDRWALDFRLGKGLINSLQTIPTTLIFQTRKQVQPDKCLKVTEAHRIQLSENEHFITWSMTWRST